MTAAVYSFPLAGPVSNDLHLPADKIQEITGYKRAGDQLAMLHELGFVRAYIPRAGAKRVLLERSHYEAVTRGAFQQPQGAAPARPAPGPNRAGLDQFFKKNRKQ